MGDLGLPLSGREGLANYDGSCFGYGVGLWNVLR